MTGFVLFSTGFSYHPGKHVGVAITVTLQFWREEMRNLVKTVAAAVCIFLLSASQVQAQEAGQPSAGPLMMNWLIVLVLFGLVCLGFLAVVVLLVIVLLFIKKGRQQPPGPENTLDENRKELERRESELQERERKLEEREERLKESEEGQEAGSTVEGEQKDGMP